MNKTVNQLTKGDVVLTTTGPREVESSVRLSMLSRGRSMGKRYAETHNEVRWANGTESIWNSGTVVPVQ